MAIQAFSGAPQGLRLAAAAGAPGYALALAAALAARIPQPGAATTFGVALGWYALQAAASAPCLALLVALLARRAGNAPAGGRFVAAALRASPRLWIAGLVYSLLVAVGLVFLLLPGVLASIAFVLYAPAVVLEGAGPLHALGSAYARARRGWGEVGRWIAGPYVFYGVVLAIGVGPAVLAAARLLSRALAATAQGVAVPDLAQLAHRMSSVAAPAWFTWGVMPALAAAAELYLLAGVVTAWLALDRSAEVTPASPPQAS